jgi:hypothetical protein
MIQVPLYWWDPVKGMQQSRMGTHISDYFRKHVARPHQLANQQSWLPFLQGIVAQCDGTLLVDGANTTAEFLCEQQAMHFELLWG